MCSSHQGPTLRHTNNFGIDTVAQMRVVTQRDAGLIHDAEQYRLARSDQPVDHLSSCLVHSIRASLERPVASVRRAFLGVEPPRDETCPDGVLARLRSDRDPLAHAMAE